MIDRITCSTCGTVNNLNPEKHTCRPKWCQGCRAIIAKPTQPFTRFYVVKDFLSQLPVIKQQIEKEKKKKGMRARGIVHERDLRRREDAAKRELGRMLKDFPHLKEWGI